VNEHYLWNGEKLSQPEQCGEPIFRGCNPDRNQSAADDSYIMKFGSFISGSLLAQQLVTTSMSARVTTRWSAWVHLRNINCTGIKVLVTRAKHWTSLFWNVKQLLKTKINGKSLVHRDSNMLVNNYALPIRLCNFLFSSIEFGPLGLCVLQQRSDIY
jgi:hypothetical protein